MVTLFKGKSVAGMGFKSRIPALHPLRISTKNPVQSFLQQKVITLETLTSLSYHPRRTSPSGDRLSLKGKCRTAAMGEELPSSFLRADTYQQRFALASKSLQFIKRLLVNASQVIAAQEASPNWA